MNENHILFESIVNQTSEATLSNMFGKPCGKINKKAFVAFFQDEMVFKIGKEEITHLLKKYPSSKNWDPSGKNRAMKDWIQIPVEFQADWEKLALKAVDFTIE